MLSHLDTRITVMRSMLLLKYTVTDLLQKNLHITTLKQVNQVVWFHC